MSWVLSAREASARRRERVSCHLKENVDLKGCWVGVGNLMDHVLADQRDASVGWTEEQIRGDGELGMCREVLEVMRDHPQRR